MQYSRTDAVEPASYSATTPGLIRTADTPTPYCYLAGSFSICLYRWQDCPDPLYRYHMFMSALLQREPNQDLIIEHRFWSETYSGSPDGQLAPSRTFEALGHFAVRSLARKRRITPS